MRNLQAQASTLSGKSISMTTTNAATRPLTQQDVPPIFLVESRVPAPKSRVTHTLAVEFGPLITVSVLFAASRLWGPLVFETGALTDRLLISRLFPQLFGIYAAFFVLAYAVWRSVAQRSPLVAFRLETWTLFRRAYLTPRRVGAFTIVWMCYTLVLGAFSAWKLGIPDIHPYAWDDALIRLDIAIHGTDPWRLLQPLLGYPPVTAAIDLAYYLWFFLITLVPIWQGWLTKRRELRAQFLLAYMLSWILLGSAAAIAFSSVGPCFYGPLTGSDHFAPLMTYLHDVHQSDGLLAIAAQDWMWKTFLTEDYRIAITAMPSMHVAAVWVIALLGWRTGPITRVIFPAFAVIISIGSVHLGWHYAVDAYASIIGVTLIWWGCGHFVRWYSTRTGAFS